MIDIPIASDGSGNSSSSSEQEISSYKDHMRKEMLLWDLKPVNKMKTKMKSICSIGPLRLNRREGSQSTTLILHDRKITAEDRQK